MKNFNYTARDTGGALKKGHLAAADRSGALEALRAKGLVPVALEEGAAARSGPAWRLDAIWLRRAVLAVVLLVAVGAFVIVGLASRQKSKPADAAVKPAADTGTRSADRGGPPAALPAAEEPVPPVAEPVAETPAPPAGPAVRPDNTVKIPAPKTVRPMIVSDLRPGKTNSPPDGLSSGTERILNTMFTARLGGPPPPLLYFPPQEATNLVAVLSSDIIVFDDDDDDAVSKKENLAVVKQKLKEFLQAGGKAEDFMVYYRDILKEAYAERTEVQQAYNALRVSGDEKAAAEYFEEANKALLEKGYLPLSVPPARARRE